MVKSRHTVFGQCGKRVRVRIPLAALLLLCACAAPTTVIVGPPCATDIDVEDGTALGPRVALVDNGRDWPMRGRNVHVRYPDGALVDEPVTSTEQETGRLLAGACLGCTGAGALGYAGLALANGTATLDNAGVFAVVGAGLVSVGFISGMFGWRANPASGVMPDRCGEHSRRASGVE